VLEVVPGATGFQRLADRDGQFVAVEKPAPGEPVVYAAYDESSTFIGYAIEGEGPGFQDTIALLYGFDPSRRIVTGMAILQSRETPGLGDKIFKDDDFRANFADLAVEPAIELVKDGRTAANEVDAITGATISSKAIVRIINEAHASWTGQLPSPGAEPVFEQQQPADSEAGQ